MYEAAAINRISFGSTHLRFQLGIFRFESIAIAFKFLHFRLQHVQLVVGDFQLFLGAMDVQERRDAYEKTPPGPIPDLHKCTNIPLNTANGQFLGKFESIRNSCHNRWWWRRLRLPAHVAVQLVVSLNIHDSTTAVVWCDPITAHHVSLPAD